MKGFEIRINDDKSIIAVSDSSISVIISVGYQQEKDNIHIEGIDSKLYHLLWLDKEIKTGDKIRVRLVEQEVASPLQNKYPSDRKQLKEKYFNLKRQLECKGLLY